MKRPTRLLLRAARVTDMPQQLIRQVPRVILEANTRVFVENHGGIRDFTEKKICIDTALACLLVTGDALQIERMNQRNLWISGKIESVEYRRPGECNEY